MTKFRADTIDVLEHRVRVAFLQRIDRGVEVPVRFAETTQPAKHPLKTHTFLRAHNGPCPFASQSGSTADL